MRRIPDLSELEIAECQQLIRRKLFRYFGSRLGPEDREDTCSNAMLNVLLRLTAYDPSRGSFWNYIDQIASSSMLDQLRSHRRTCRTSVSLNSFSRCGDGDRSELSESVEERCDFRRQAELRDMTIDLVVAMKALDEQEQRLFQARIDGVSALELAKQFGVARGTIYRRLRVIAKKLRKLESLV